MSFSRDTIEARIRGDAPLSSLSRGVLTLAIRKARA